MSQLVFHGPLHARRAVLRPSSYARRRVVRRIQALRRSLSRTRIPPGWGRSSSELLAVVVVASLGERIPPSPLHYAPRLRHPSRLRGRKRKGGRRRPTNGSRHRRGWESSLLYLRTRERKRGGESFRLRSPPQQKREWQHRCSPRPFLILPSEDIGRKVFPSRQRESCRTRRKEEKDRPPRRTPLDSRPGNTSPSFGPPLPPASAVGLGQGWETPHQTTVSFLALVRSIHTEDNGWTGRIRSISTTGVLTCGERKALRAANHRADPFCRPPIWNCRLDCTLRFPPARNAAHRHQDKGRYIFPRHFFSRGKTNSWACERIRGGIIDVGPAGSQQLKEKKAIGCPCAS